MSAAESVAAAFTKIVTPGQADLATTLAGTGIAAVGGYMGYRITVTNNGPDPASNVVVTDPTPAGLRPSTLYCVRERPAPRKRRGMVRPIASQPALLDAKRGFTRDRHMHADQLAESGCLRDRHHGDSCRALLPQPTDLRHGHRHLQHHRSKYPQQHRDRLRSRNFNPPAAPTAHTHRSFAPGSPPLSRPRTTRGPELHLHHPKGSPPPDPAMSKP